MNKVVGALIAIVLCVSCADDPVEESENLKIRIDSNFEGTDFNLFQEYLNVTDYGMKVEGLRMYISDIRIQDYNNKETQISEIEFFNFATDELSSQFVVPAGNYKGFSYSIGVPQDLNGTNDSLFDPLQYSFSHPLSLDNGMYWAWAPGYRFVSFEGRVDTTPGVGTEDPTPFAIHMGKDLTFQTIDVELPFTVSENGMTDLVLDLNVAKCIYNSSDQLYLDDPNDGQFHGGNIDLALRFGDFLAGAFEYRAE